MSPGQLPRIQSQDAGLEARVNGTFEQRRRQLIILRHVELEEPWPVAIRLSHILMLLLPAVLRQYGRSNSAATFATGSSPAGWYILLIPIGFAPMGAGTRWPNIVVAVSRLLVSRSMRGMMRCR